MEAINEDSKPAAPIADRRNLRPGVGVLAAVVGLGAVTAGFSARQLLFSQDRDQGIRHTMPAESGDNIHVRAPAIEGTPAALEQLVFNLAATDSCLTVSEVMTKLSEVAENSPHLLSKNRLEVVMSEWAASTPYLAHAHEIAANWSTISNSNPEWVQSLISSHVTGTALVIPNLESNSLQISYRLKPAEAQQAQLEWQTLTATMAPASTAEDATQRPAWIQVMMSKTDEILFSATGVPQYQAGQDLAVALVFDTYSESEQIGRHSIQRRFSIIPAADGKTLSYEMRLADGSPVSEEATALMRAFDSVKAAEFRMQKAERARAEQSPHSREGIEDHRGTPSMDHPSVHKPAPPVSLVDWSPDGRPTNAIGSNADLRIEGKVTLLDFWTTWCGPCAMAMPTLGELHHKLQDRGFQVISLTSTRDPRDFENVNGIVNRSVKHPVALGAAATFDQFDVRAYPTLVLIDRDGVVRWRGVGAGALPPDELMEELLSTSTSSQGR